MSETNLAWTASPPTAEPALSKIERWLADNYPQSAHDVYERSKQPMRSNRVRMSEEIDWIGMRLSKMSGIFPVRIRKMTTHPHPPYTPLGYKFPKKFCRLFISQMESTSVEKIQPQNIPHGEIWPLKIAGKSWFFP
jgi:hypothetical protein